MSTPPTNPTGEESERSPFAQDVLASMQSIAQQEPVEMRPMPQTPAVADPPIDANEILDNDGSLKTAEEPTSAIPAEAAEPAASANPKDTVAAAQDIVAPAPAPGSSASPVKDDEGGIGPATERSALEPVISVEGGNQLVITLLLHATDTRHPYVLDPSYLARRNVQVEGDDPSNMSVYTLKELIMRDWRPEWEAKPASPSSIRLIHMGRLLDDKWYLKDTRFVCGSTPHVVHMTIKPPETGDDEDGRMGKGGRDGPAARVCRCLIM